MVETAIQPSGDKSVASSSPNRAQMIRSMLLEDHHKSLGDRRDINRVPFSRRMVVMFVDSKLDPVAGYTRDISDTGIGLLTRDAIPRKVKGEIAIHRFGEDPAWLAAECRWCRPQPGGWYASGWQLTDDEPAEK